MKNIAEMNGKDHTYKASQGRPKRRQKKATKVLNPFQICSPPFELQDIEDSEKVIKICEGKGTTQNECDIIDEKSPLWKTRLCKFAPYGVCQRGDGCMFAHGREELRASPDFTRTSMCPDLLRGACTNPKCRYAHASHELREIPDLLKTKVCRFHANGTCFLGSHCRFAHCEKEVEAEGDCTSAYAASTCADEKIPFLDLPSSTDFPDRFPDEALDHVKESSMIANCQGSLGSTPRESWENVNYQGMSPGSTPLNSPRLGNKFRGVWMNRVGACKNFSKFELVQC